MKCQNCGVKSTVAEPFPIKELCLPCAQKISDEQNNARTEKIAGALRQVAVAAIDAAVPHLGVDTDTLAEGQYEAAVAAVVKVFMEGPVRVETKEKDDDTK